MPVVSHLSSNGNFFSRQQGSELLSLLYWAVLPPVSPFHICNAVINNAMTVLSVETGKLALLACKVPSIATSI